MELARQAPASTCIDTTPVYMNRRTPLVELYIETSGNIHVSLTSLSCISSWKYLVAVCDNNNWSTAVDYLSYRSITRAEMSAMDTVFNVGKVRVNLLFMQRLWVPINHYRWARTHTHTLRFSRASHPHIYIYIYIYIQSLVIIYRPSTPIRPQVE